MRFFPGNRPPRPQKGDEGVQELANGKKEAEEHLIIGLHEEDRKITAQKVGELEAAVEKSGEHIHTLEEQLGVDHLTGLKNRKYFEQELEKSLNRMYGGIEEHRKKSETHEEMSLVFIDLDHFKEVNDTRGHSVGDEVIKGAAGLMRDAFREHDTVARLGGDEFVVILPDTNAAEATEVAEKIRKMIDDSPLLKEHSVTASIGIASANTGMRVDSKILIDRADIALYAAKKAGRNRVETYKGRT